MGFFNAFETLELGEVCSIGEQRDEISDQELRGCLSIVAAAEQCVLKTSLRLLVCFPKPFHEILNYLCILLCLNKRKHVFVVWIFF